MVTGALAKALNLPQAAGVLVQRIGDGSIGSRLGINPGTLRVTIQGADILLGGDVILDVNNIGVIDPRSAQSLGSFTSDENYERIYNSVAALKPGDPLVVTVFREGKVLKLTTTIDSSMGLSTGAVVLAGVVHEHSNKSRTTFLWFRTSRLLIRNREFSCLFEVSSDGHAIQWGKALPMSCRRRAGGKGILQSAK